MFCLTMIQCRQKCRFQCRKKRVSQRCKRLTVSCQCRKCRFFFLALRCLRKLLSVAGNYELTIATNLTGLLIHISFFVKRHAKIVKKILLYDTKELSLHIGSNHKIIGCGWRRYSPRLEAPDDPDGGALQSKEPSRRSTEYT